MIAASLPSANGTYWRLRGFAGAMHVEKSTRTQILIAWRDNHWVVSRDAVEAGAYAYRNHAMDMVRALSAEEAEAGRACYMLLLDKDGHWEERPCPKPRRRRVASEPAKD